MDEEEDDEEMDKGSSHVGSPSPPYEGVISEEASKELESQGGEFEPPTADDGDDNEEVIKFPHKFRSQFELFPQTFSCKFIETQNYSACKFLSAIQTTTTTQALSRNITN